MEPLIMAFDSAAVWLTVIGIIALRLAIAANRDLRAREIPIQRRKGNPRA